MRDSPRSPTVKTNGSSREGNRIINPHSRIPKSTNKQTNKHILFALSREDNGRTGSANGVSRGQNGPPGVLVHDGVP